MRHLARGRFEKALCKIAKAKAGKNINGIITIKPGVPRQC
jgi:hypothetical protein